MTAFQPSIGQQSQLDLFSVAVSSVPLAECDSHVELFFRHLVLEYFAHEHVDSTARFTDVISDLAHSDYAFHRYDMLHRIITNRLEGQGHLVGFYRADGVHSFRPVCTPSPADQDCTPDGGVSANRADDNSTGGVTTPEVTWRASGSHSHGGAHE